MYKDVIPRSSTCLFRSPRQTFQKNTLRVTLLKTDLCVSSGQTLFNRHPQLMKLKCRIYKSYRELLDCVDFEILTDTMENMNFLCILKSKMLTSHLMSELVKGQAVSHAGFSVGLSSVSLR